MSFFLFSILLPKIIEITSVGTVLQTIYRTRQKTVLCNWQWEKKKKMKSCKVSQFCVQGNGLASVHQVDNISSQNLARDCHSWALAGRIWRCILSYWYLIHTYANFFLFSFYYNLIFFFFIFFSFTLKYRLSQSNVIDPSNINLKKKS